MPRRLCRHLLLVCLLVLVIQDGAAQSLPPVTEPWTPWAAAGTSVIQPGAGWAFVSINATNTPWGFTVNCQARTDDTGCPPTQTPSVLGIEYRIPATPLGMSTVPSRVRIRLSHASGPRSVLWRGVSLSLPGGGTVPQGFVAPTGASAWGRDGSGASCGAAPPSGMNDFLFVWEDSSPNGHAQLSIVDGIAPQFWKGPALSTDVEDLSSGGEVRFGTVADGVSRLLIRITASVPGTISVGIPLVGQCAPGSIYAGNQPATAGFLATIDGATQGPSLQAHTSFVPAGHTAAVWYQAPAVFDVPGTMTDLMPIRTVCLTIRFDADSTNPVTTQQLDTMLGIRRVPFILCHGIWSKPGTWGDIYSMSQSGYPAEPEYVDYRHDVGRHFASNVRHVINEIDKVKMRVRAVDYCACSQVDWVGHSMGGLLPRTYVSLARDGRLPRGFYRRPDNMMAGDLHKLITINTPHFGSPLANLLMTIRASLNPLPLTTMSRGEFDALTRAIGCPAGDGSVEDLMQGSAALAAMGETPVPSHAIVGTGGAQVVTALGVGAWLAGLAVPELAGLAKVIAWSCRGVTAYTLLGGRQHDLIVFADSQRGGLGTLQSTTFSGIDSIHTRVTQNVPIRDRVIQLLRAPIGNFGPSDLFAAGLPSPQTGQLTVPAPTFGPINPPLRTSLATHFGTLAGPFHQLDLLQFPILGQPQFPNGNHTLIDSLGNVLAPTILFNSMYYTVPDDAMGTLDLFYVSEDPASGTIAITPPVTVPVDPWYPAYVTIDQPSDALYLYFPGEEVTPTWTGSDGGATADITSMVTLTSSAPGVATMVGGNRIRAVSEGDAVVTADWLGQTATLPVHVEFVTVAAYAGASGATVGAQLRLTAGGGRAVLGNAVFRLDLSWNGPPAPTYLVVGPRAIEQPVGGLLLLVPPEESFVIPFPAAAAQAFGSGSVLHISAPIPNTPTLAGQMLFLQAARVVPGAWLAESGGLRLMFVP